MNYTYDYPRPAVTTDAILITKKQNEIYILLIERGNDPYKGKWALPGGFIEMDEELEHACSRELQEETGITDISLTQFSAFGSVGRDPRGRTISIVFWAKVNTTLKASYGDDAVNAEWYKINELPPLAFDHKEIINKFIEEKLKP